MSLEWGTPGKVSVLVDGQFGSTGKGLVAAYLSQFACTLDPIATCNAGANAGHTTKYRSGREFVCFHLPTTGVLLDKSRVYINAGSIIEPGVLGRELSACKITPDRVFIHPRAAVITDENMVSERANGSSTEKSGSTQKGVGAAIADKVMRRGVLAEHCSELLDYGSLAKIDLNDQLRYGRAVIMEVPQGFSLSLNHGLEYPYTTSRDCWVGSGMNDAGIHPSFLGPVAMVVRTFPIRVGHIFDQNNVKVGDSGPFYNDSRELYWDKDFPGIEPERTTVTKRVRRIATWSSEQYFDACSMNRPSIVVLNFVNYLKNADALRDLVLKMRSVESDVGIRPAHAYGLGPHTEDVVSSMEEAAEWLKRNR